MAETFYQQHRTTTSHQPWSHQGVKAVTAATASGSLMILSGLTFTGTVIGIVAATPLLIIFSPALVPAAITLLLIMIGFVTSGGLGVAAITVLSWFYRYVTKKQPAGSVQVGNVRTTLASKARELKERAGQKQRS